MIRLHWGKCADRAPGVPPRGSRDPGRGRPGAGRGRCGISAPSRGCSSGSASPPRGGCGRSGTGPCCSSPRVLGCARVGRAPRVRCSGRAVAALRPRAGANALLPSPTPLPSRPPQFSPPSPPYLLIVLGRGAAEERARRPGAREHRGHHQRNPRRNMTCGNRSPASVPRTRRRRPTARRAVIAGPVSRRSSRWLASAANPVMR